MNSYDDSEPVRANVGGPADPPRPTGANGRAAVGSATVGTGGGEPARAGVGRATVGRAVVPAPPQPGNGGGANGANGTPRPNGANGYHNGESNGYDSGNGNGYDHGVRPSGRAVVGAAVGAASVGAPPAAGRATVGRAVVRPVSPAPHPYTPVSPGGPGAPGGPAGPGGPGGPGGPKSRGSAGKKRSRRRRTINLLVAAFAIFVILAGAGVVGGTYYTTTVALPDQIDLPLASTIYSSDNKKLATVGEVNRTFVKIDQVPDFVQKAVASAEDRKFYEHSGIDYAGIVRAAWNNVTGGDTQGASTITQQYARNAFDMQGVTYARKIREAVVASKLTDSYSKNEIMQMYLNTIYFGRGAYGIEAAAQTYFGKSVDKLNVAEAAVLAAVIKQPMPSATHKGFDPGINPSEAQSRWTYVINGMVDKGWLTADKVPAAYPKVLPPAKEGACVVGCGIDKPTGNVVNYVREEMIAMGLCKPETCSKEIRDGGYKIKTSINSKMQTALENAIWRKRTNSVIAKQKKSMIAAGVAIDPKTGRVMAYFGGDNGTGTDYAGLNTDPKTGALVGGHPPGSSFKIYTLAAALDNNISLESHWDAKPFKAPGIDAQIRNAGGNASCGSYCTLRQSVVKSYNVPFYHITEALPAGAVVDMAKAAGVRTMWDNEKGEAHDLTNAEGKELHPSVFFHVLGYGAYPITVLDHANGLATIANRGMYNKAHFVLSVEQKDPETGKWRLVGGEDLDPQQTIRPEVADDVNDVLQEIPRNNGDSLDGGRPATGKTGTWELNEKSADNAHAWMIGATPQLATAIWVGNVGKQVALIDDDGERVQGSGLPAEIWKRFMDKALDGKDVEQFPDGKGIGNPDAGNGKSPAPTAPPCAPTDLLCLFRDRDNRGNGNGNGNGGGGGNNDDNTLFGDTGGTTPLVPPPPG